MSIALAPLALFMVSQVATPGPANMALLATGARYGVGPALPFVAGVTVGKQLIVWPIGFGLMELAVRAPAVFEALKWASAAYIFWLAWRIAHMRLAPGEAKEAPGFVAGLWVHPLNPKAWAMILGGFTHFVSPDTPAFHATLTLALTLLICQSVLHPVWTLAGQQIARTLAGTRAEPYLMKTLAALTVASVLFVLFGGGT